VTPTGSGNAEPGDPYRYRMGWSAGARVSATQRVRDAVQEGSDLLEVSERVLEVIREVLVAARVTVTLIEGDQYRDLVNVGDLHSQQVRFPDHLVYPVSTYPASTAQLLAHEGYISTSSDLEVVREYIALAPQATVGCFMGVPIAAAGEVQGELFALRNPDAPPFMPEDVEIATDFATQFGSRLPELLAAKRASDPDW